MHAVETRLTLAMQLLTGAEGVPRWIRDRTPGPAGG